MIPQQIEHQVRQVAEYFAKNMSLAARSELPETPDWLEQDARLWIRRHHFEFSDLVLAAHRAAAVSSDI